MKKVTIVVSTYPPYRGGMGNVAHRQAKLLQDKGYSVQVITSGEVNEDSEHDGVLVKRMRALVRYGNAALLSNVNTECRDSDIIFLHYPFFGTAELLKVRGRSSYLQGGKLVMYYHMDVVGKGWLKMVFALHRRFILPWVIRRADMVLVSSQSYYHASFLRELRDIHERVRVLPLSVPVSDELIEGDTHEPVALFVGGLDSAHYFKGINVLLQAWHKVIEIMPRAQLRIVGDGDLREQYEREAAELGIVSNVTFLGSVDELKEEYRAARVTVLPSVDKSEAFGLVQLESMAEGTPVVVSDLPGVNSVARGDFGQLVPPNDVDALVEALINILQTPLTEARRNEVRNYVREHYCDEVVGKQLDMLLQEL